MSQLVDSLRELGYAQTTLTDLFQGHFSTELVGLRSFARNFAQSETVQRANECFDKGINRGELKEFLCKFRPQALNPITDPRPDDLVWWFGKQRPVTEPICHALGKTKIYYWWSDLWYVMPNGVSRQRAWSQSWHRDPEADTVVKVMLYVTDVDAASGPLQYVQRSHAGKYVDLCLPKRYPDRDIAPLIDPADIVTFECKADTVVFVNTSGLHRGGYTISKPRLSGVWTYVA